MRMHIGALVMTGLSDETLGKAERRREEDTLGLVGSRRRSELSEFDKNAP